MEFLQVPETPAPEPADAMELPDECSETHLGISFPHSSTQNSLHSFEPADDRE